MPRFSHVKKPIAPRRKVPTSHKFYIFVLNRKVRGIRSTVCGTIIYHYSTGVHGEVATRDLSQNYLNIIRPVLIILTTNQDLKFRVNSVLPDMEDRLLHWPLREIYHRRNNNGSSSRENDPLDTVMVT